MVSSATKAQEVRGLIAGIVLVTMTFSSCNQAKRHASVPQAVRTSNPKPVSGKQVIEQPITKLKKQPHRLEAPSARVSPTRREPAWAPSQGKSEDSKRSFKPTITEAPVQPDPEPRIAEIELPESARPTEPNEIETLPKIDKVKPLFQKPQQPAVDSVGEVIINANNSTRIIDAQGRRVIVTGSDGLILITGGTEKLTVKGDSNQIQCDTVTDILVSGNRNNVVLDKFGGGEVSGNSNKVNWGEGLLGGFNPIVNNTGSDNTIGAN